MLTIARLKRWGIGYYKRTAQDAVDHMKDRAKANGGLGDYYTERDTRVPTWMVTGDAAKKAGVNGVSAGDSGTDGLAGGNASPPGAGAPPPRGSGAGKVVAITGGARGIGRAIATAFAPVIGSPSPARPMAYTTP